MNSRYTIALIIPYFGKFKNYFPLFLISCQNNPTIDWLIFTDTDKNYNWPENVKVFNMEFDQFKQIVQKNFEYEVKLDSPYKLCDYKPAYGEILHNYLNTYDFWGHCDCDLIFGNIRSFISDEILDKYSKIFSRGHLTIYKNDSVTNSFYRKQEVIPCKKIYTSPQSFSFDEWPGISNIWDKMGMKFYDAMPFDDISINLTGFYPTKRISKKEIGGPYHLHNEDLSKEYKKMKHIVYRYSNGKLYRIYYCNKKINQDEVLYVHLQKRNMKIENIKDLEKESSFMICPNVFLKKVDNISVTLIKKMSPSYSFSDFFTILRSKIKNIIVRI